MTQSIIKNISMKLSMDLPIYILKTYYIEI